jgi:hypothetical protein
MELDINPTGSGAYFVPTSDGRPQGVRLFSGERVSAEHYFSPFSRDWYAFYTRP